MTQRRKPPTQITIDEHLLALQRIAETAEEQNKLAVALKATELQGKVLGFYVEKHVHEVGPRTNLEIMAHLNALLESSPHIRMVMEKMQLTGLSPDQKHAVLAAAGGIGRLQESSAAASLSEHQNGRQSTDSGQYPPSSQNHSSESYSSSVGPENSASSESIPSPDIQPSGSPSLPVS